MFTIKELEDKRNDYESACLLTIKQLLADYKEVTFDFNSSSPYCLIDYGDKIASAIITSIRMDSFGNLFTKAVCEIDNNYTIEDKLEYLCNIDYIDIITQIKKKLKNGKINLGKEA